VAAHIHQFLCLADNFGVLVHDPGTRATAAIDAPEAGPILAALAAREWELTDILITHHHADHVQGIAGLKAKFPRARVIGPAEAYSNVAVHPQITGQLTSVEFKEGQDVRKGEIIFTLDFRPLESALEQANADRRRSEAEAAAEQAEAVRSKREADAEEWSEGLIGDASTQG